jgi:hypothetical protein
VGEDNTSSEQVVPRGNPALTIGKNIDQDVLASSISHMTTTLEKEVYHPLHEWFKEFKKVQVSVPMIHLHIPCQCCLSADKQILNTSCLKFTPLACFLGRREDIECFET